LFFISKFLAIEVVLSFDLDNDSIEVVLTLLTNLLTSILFLDIKNNEWDSF